MSRLRPSHNMTGNNKKGDVSTAPFATLRASLDMTGTAY